MASPTGHVCSCGECETEPFADRCKYEAALTAMNLDQVMYLIRSGPERADIHRYIDAISTQADFTEPYLHLGKTIARQAFYAGWRALSEILMREIKL